MSKELGHDLEELSPNIWHCTVCLVSWRYLTARDRLLLTKQGKCIGEVERWRSCSIHTGTLCIGHSGVCL